MNSMTGFGRAAVTVAGRRLLVEVRSVNHRAFDAKVRARELDGACEIELLRAVRQAIARGSVQISVREEGAAGGGVDPARVRAAHAALETLRSELGIGAPVDLATVAAFLAADPGIGTAADVGWEDLRPAVEQALGALQRTRADEGAALAAELRRRSASLRALVGRIGAAAVALPTRAAKRLDERLAALREVAPVEPARLAQEVALLADRLDVSEELVRLETHLGHLDRLLEGGGEPAGRRIDFLVQELGRELNTIGSKVQDAEIAALVIDGKAELEKIREQAQNIE